LALLAEFTRHDSVASLAGEIAKRLGAGVRGRDLIAAADLGLSERGEDEMAPEVDGRRSPTRASLD
jgi:hypothetical protein